MQVWITNREQQIRSMRRIATELRPAPLDDMGLLAALEWQFGEFLTRTEIEGNFECSVENLPVSANAATVVFRIFQETLTNIARHAQAHRVTVQMALEANEFVLVVTDNGLGLPASGDPTEGHLGLIGMRERASSLGGNLEVVRVPEKGATMRVRFSTAGQVSICIGVRHSASAQQN